MNHQLLRILAVLPLLLASLSCAKSPDPMLYQIAVAEDQRSISPDSLDRWVSSPDSLVRARAAYVIGIVGQSDSYLALTRLMNDSIQSVSAAAIFAAGQSGDTTLQDILIQLSTSGRSLIKLRSLQALSKLGTAAASSRISTVVNDVAEPADIRSAAARSLFRFKDRLSENALIAQAASENASLREAVYYALSRRAVKDAQPLFVLGLNDQINQIQIYAINGLSRINDSAAAPRVVDLLLSPYPRVRYHATNYVSKFSLMEALPMVLDIARSETDPYVKTAAVQALGALKDNSSSLELLELIADSNVNIASEALVAYAKHSRPDVIGFAELFSASSSVRKRQAAAQVFGSAKGDTSRALLEYMFKDTIAAVRGEVFEQILSLGDLSLSDRYIGMALQDPDFMPVALASNAIATSHLTAFVPQLCELYDQTGVYEKKQSVLDALIEMADSVEGTSQLMTLAHSALSNSEFSIRKRGRELLSKLGVDSSSANDHFTSDLTSKKYVEIYETKSQARVSIETVRGNIVVELLPQSAPKTVANFLTLIGNGFYNNRVWHRVVPDFVIQDGCPRGDGWGSPGYEIRCEYNSLPFERGTMGMATSGKDTGGSQYFICHSAQPHLDGRYTVFGRVIEGLEIVDQIQLGDSIRAVTVQTNGVN